ncbi:MAG TPA: TIR domain-containing protein, partial [Microthrixaceae bacterium]|nr:TIR domain-containing protein [Microthrixaceae bacterium]
MQEFDAFISYSHAADGRLAPEIQRGLQRLAKGTFQRRALSVFRDETGLSTNPHLWGSIEAALDHSKWFVLLASPDAANSDWVARELTTWLAAHPIDHLLIVVTDGEIGFLSDAGVDRAATTCLPAPLFDALDNEPRWLDMRWARTDAQLDLRNGRFRAAIADLAAPIHGVPNDDLEGEDVRQQKRARRLAVSGIATVGLFAIVSLIAALVAVDRSKEARDQRNVAAARQAEAEAQREQADTARADAEASQNVAVARGLAAQAATVSPADVDLGLLLGAEGYRRDPSLDSETGLLTALDNAGGITELVRTMPTGIVDLEISPDRATA